MPVNMERELSSRDPSAPDTPHIAPRIGPKGAAAHRAAVVHRHLEPQAVVGGVAPRPDLAAGPAAVAPLAGRPIQRSSSSRVRPLAACIWTSMNSASFEHLPRLRHAAGSVEIDHPRHAAVGAGGVFQPFGAGRQHVAAGRAHPRCAARRRARYPGPAAVWRKRPATAWPRPAPRSNVSWTSLAPVRCVLEALRRCRFNRRGRT